MVAREDMPGDEGGRGRMRRFTAALFLTWRRSLTRAIGHLSLGAAPVSTAAHRTVASLGTLVRFLARPASPLTPVQRRGLSHAGLASLATGTLLTVVLARPSLPEAAVAAVWMPLLALLRLLVLRLAAPRTPARELRDAWATGLLAGAIAVTDPLRLAALAVWAWLARGTLAASTGRRDARRAIALAVAAEMAFWLLRWAGRGVLLFLIARV